MYKLNEKGRKMFIEASEECPFSFKTSEILNSSFVSFEEADEKIKEEFDEQFSEPFGQEHKKRFFCYSKELDIFINKELLKEAKNGK